MDQVTKQKVLEILGYWELTEFLEQKDIELQDKSMKEAISNLILKGIPLPERQRTVEVYHNIGKKITNEISIDDFFGKSRKNTEELLNEDIEKIKKTDMEQLLSEDNKYFEDFPELGNECEFSIGNIPRNDIVEYLMRYLPEEERQLPEQPYQQDEAIAWFVFKTNSDGKYTENSFGLSPILWTLSEWKKRGGGPESYSINTVKYKSDCEAFENFIYTVENTYGSARLEMFLPQIYGRVFTEYIRDLFPNILQNSCHEIGFFKYERRRKPKKSKKTAFNVKMGSGGFFLDEISNLKEQISGGYFGDGSEYERSVINYILSADCKRMKREIVERISISPKNDIVDSFGFFSDILNIKNAPNAKWPSRFMPALMQQTAVNLAVKRGRDSTPIFSVNGPPGTGKTTLLKEIVANNIVERAKALAEYAGDDPDSIFEGHSFKEVKNRKGTPSYTPDAPKYFKFRDEFDEINDYGMLAASSNNAAVENITIDLPKLEDLLDSIVKPDDIQNGTADPALKEIRGLFDPDLSDDIETVSVYDKEQKTDIDIQVRDILFTRYSDALVNSETADGDEDEDGDENENKDKKKKEGAPKIKTWGLISAPLGKSANVKKYCGTVLIPFLKDYGDSKVRAAHLQKYRGLRRKFIEQYERVEALKSELEMLCVDCATAPDKFKLPEKFGRDKPVVLDMEFMRKYSADDKNNGNDSTLAQLSDPWATAELDREREKLFYYACKLHKEFIISSDCMRQNIVNALIAWNMSGDLFMYRKDKEEAFPVILQTLFLLTPVFSTTFASVKTFLRSAKCAGIIGTLIVDEAGQAPPHYAVGALYRCRRAVIVGDPKQIEPVVTAETDMFKRIMTSKTLSGYKDKRISVQGFADYINPYGTFLGEGSEREWVGCPLVVHRRCTDPMYTISNKLSYDETMKNSGREPSKDDRFILPFSCWINIGGPETKVNKGHYVENQGKAVLKLLAAAFKKTDGLPKLYIISPFTSVAVKIKEEIGNSRLFKTDPRVKDWLDAKNIGTVHTFQGKGTDEVIFLLGCDKTSMAAANWVNKNIVNVAATRAKKRFYVIGDKYVWNECIPVKTAREIIDNELTEHGLDRFLEEYLTSSVSDRQQTLKNAQPPITSSVRICPRCGKQLAEKESSNGVYWNCGSCGYTTVIRDQLVTCPECGGKLGEKSSKYGKFWSCLKYPNCKYIPRCPQCMKNNSLYLETINGVRVWKCRYGHTFDLPPRNK